MVKEDGSTFSDQQTFAVTTATSLVIVVSVQVKEQYKQKWPDQNTQLVIMMHVFVPRLDLRNTTGQLSITSCYGAAW